MLDACYYSLIERVDDGRFVAWVPDLSGVTAAGHTEDETLRALSRNTRRHLGKLVLSGKALAAAPPGRRAAVRSRPAHPATSVADRRLSPRGSTGWRSHPIWG
jgi:predicted RNase H-like HicB family nuclease